MRRIVASFVLAWMLAVSHRLDGAQKTKLSQVQIEQLVKVGAPDEVIAREIHDRGVAFTPNEKALQDLQRRGAGAQTLSVLRSLMPSGTLDVQTQPGAEVSLDAALAGTADAQGRLQLDKLPAGQHKVSVRKSGYRPAESDFVLAEKEHKLLLLEPEWAGGFLTVHSDQPGATVEIAGLGQYGDVSDMPCPPGQYNVTVSRTGMKPETQSILVTAGQHARMDAHLVPDPEYLRKMLTDAKQRFDRGDPKGAIQESRSVLALKPDDPEADGLLAAAYLRLQDARNFQNSAADALRNGGSVTLDLMHEHLQLSGESIHPAALTITATSIAYDRQGSLCKYEGFTTPLRNIEVAQVTNASTSFIMHHITPGTFLLRIEVRNPWKAKGKISLDFATQDSRTEIENGASFLTSQRGSAQMLGAVANVIRSAASGGGAR